jgi:hypothetical protein
LQHSNDVRFENKPEGAVMTILHQDIVESFLKRLEELDEVDTQKIEQLRALFDGGKKLKTEDIIKILSPSAAEVLK